MSEQKEVYSVKEIAEYLGLSESKVRQLVRRNAIPFVRLDGQYKFFLPIIQDWLRQISIQPNNNPDSDGARIIANRIWNITGGH